jgi:SNF2 family DNA or RNA helicase
MSNVSIDISVDVNNPCYLIKGSLDEILKNKRLLISFKRLGYTIYEDAILISYQDETRINTLQEIQRLLKKFGFTQDLSENTKKELDSFAREENLFDEFTERARSIRNDEFNKNQDLVELFNQFQNVLKDKLERRLYPLQLLSAYHMAFAQNSCNFAVPGAGKTSIVYGAYAYLKSLPKDHPKRIDRLLVIGPISSFAPWENEYYECFGYPVKSFRMSGDIEIKRNLKEQHLYSSNPAELTLIFHGGVDSFQNDISDFLKRNRTMVVVDEAHRIKNPEGVWGRSVTEISKEAISRVILTGTPVPNGYQDIFNLFKFIYPFKFKDILKMHYHNLEDMTFNFSHDSSRVKELKKNISPYFIRIKKQDLNLRKPIIKEVKVEMDKYQREIYDFILDQYIPSFNENSSATVKDILNKAKLIRLRQASTNPALLSKTLKDSLEYYDTDTKDGDPNYNFTTDTDEFISDSEFFNKISNYSDFETPKKFIEVLKILQNIIHKGNGKAIIWTIFIQNAKELQTYLHNNNINSKLLIGEIPQEERELTISKVNDPTNSEFQIVIANPFSVAESISLHKGCHNAIYLERDYNCSNFLQSKDRIHRVGLPEGVETTYYYLISNDSIDEIIDRRLQIKIERMEEVIDDDIPLFSRIDDNDETDIITELINSYAQRS